jgi:hypothetical protein
MPVPAEKISTEDSTEPMSLPYDPAFMATAPPTVPGTPARPSSPESPCAASLPSNTVFCLRVCPCFRLCFQRGVDYHQRQFSVAGQYVTAAPQHSRSASQTFQHPRQPVKGMHVVQTHFGKGLSAQPECGALFQHRTRKYHGLHSCYSPSR